MHRTLMSPWEDLWETPNLRVYGGRAGRRGAMRPSLMSWIQGLGEDLALGLRVAGLGRVLPEERAGNRLGPFVELVKGNGGPSDVVSGSDR